MDSITPKNHPDRRPAGIARLQEGWVIANHILVSFHAAFISSVLAIPADAASRSEVLRFIFFSPETLVSAAFTWLVFHTAIALHELGHFLEAARLRALSDSIQDRIQGKLAQPLPGRIRYLAGMFLRIPYGRAVGVKREGLNYYPDAPYNLAVAAAGPRASLRVALVALPLAAVLLAWGLAGNGSVALYAGRLLLGLGLVTGLDFLLADRGKYREFRRRERQAGAAAAALHTTGRWLELAPRIRQRLSESSMEEATHPRLGRVRAPWQFRNCGMGGRHTEKEYPESNISMQEAMFLIIGAADSQEAQEMTVRLQNRLKEILESAEGCRVMGIGLEGGLAPYVDRGEFELPELRLWSMMKRAIEECGYRPGVDVALALDPALSELEIAYREEFDIPDAVGMYLFWRDHAKKVLDRDGVLAVYEQAIVELDIPILSIEDGFSENDHEGWRRLLDRLGERILVIGDDLVTTKDQTIEAAARQRLINTVLVKANQIGTLYETLLAILVGLGKGLELVVSHRSKSPNDDMEAHIALAANALGLKAGGGANTERLVKYQAVTTQMRRIVNADVHEPAPPPRATVRRLRAREEPTNAGIPTVGVDVDLLVPMRDSDVAVRMAFHGATPLGTSAGTEEAVHRVDAVFEGAEYREVVQHFGDLLSEVEPGVFALRDPATARASGDRALQELCRRAGRYGGKGCLFAVDHVHEFIAPMFENRDIESWGLRDIDRALLGLELALAERRGKIGPNAPRDERVRLQQRKQNLGMNAILSTSLALARAVAQVRGQELYEFLREELLVIIQQLAAAHNVTIQGSRFSDYLAALRRVNDVLERQETPLHEALRDVTAIYERQDAPVDFLRTPQVGNGQTAAPGSSSEAHDDLSVEVSEAESVVHADPVAAPGPEAGKPAFQVSRLRDLAAVLERLNSCGSAEEAAASLNFLAARFCSTRYRGMVGAKNLLPEISRVRSALIEFTNGPFADGLRQPSRILVRRIAGLVSRPKRVAEVWQDSIDLAEVRVRGSAIANEIRRSTHHAMGEPSLMLARTYRDWLKTDVAPFPDSSSQQPGPADRAARSDPLALDCVDRIVANLERLLGVASIETRIGEWRETYAGDLLRCESTNTLDQELESLVDNGILAGNRWVYQHRLRSLGSKARDGNWALGSRQAFESGLRELSGMLPGDSGFDAQEAERLARAVVAEFSERLRADHQDALFLALDQLLAEYREVHPFRSLESCSALRHEVESLCGQGVFAGQRYLLLHLDCLLEELAFAVVQQLLDRYADHGFDEPECLEAIRLCAGNLDRDGLYSQELLAVAEGLAKTDRADRELPSELEQLRLHHDLLVNRIRRNYAAMAEQLGYAESEMNTVLENVQRSLLDLDSLLALTDRAAEHAKTGRPTDPAFLTA